MNIQDGKASRLVQKDGTAIIRSNKISVGPPLRGRNPGHQLLERANLKQQRDAGVTVSGGVMQILVDAARPGYDHEQHRHQQDDFAEGSANVTILPSQERAKTVGVVVRESVIER